ncbi:polysaccharide deacetylase family protein [Dongia rigui]|uniref:Polysaccharide deacetylase n=1 Tax=Dongia rigui TaxID=940149 RepID=A0ABU5DWR4_9PROT|nr:hypothetical protein [Dongia rigui]MDY0871757.1 hypothetical protein [Dongia rigui]
MADKPVADWDALAREWDLWRADDRQPTLWWRDDDAVDVTPALDELRRVARVPLALAVIPMALERPLQERLGPYLRNWGQVRVLQHGVGHLNHAPAGAKKSEFPATRALGEIELALTVAATFLRDTLGPDVLPVLTPPWNRIGAPALELLLRLGFHGVSRFDAFPYVAKTPELPRLPPFREINTQIDVIDWRGTRGFVGAEPALGWLVAHLSARRQGVVDPGLPTGILTHHLVHDTATWRFLENLQDWLARRGELGVFQDPRALWPLP